MDNPEALTTSDKQVTGRRQKKRQNKDEQHRLPSKHPGTLVIVNDEQFSYDTHHVTNIAKYFDDIKFKIKSKYLQYQ